MSSSTLNTRRLGPVWLAAGVLAVLGGLLGLLNPLATTLTAEQLAGWAFLIVGVLQGIDAFRADGWRGRMLAIILAVLSILLALSLLAQPLRGVLALTVVVAVLLLAGGAAKAVLSWQLLGAWSFWLVLASGLLSVALGLIILANFPWSAAAVLGILLSLELISSGISLLTLWALSGRHVVQAA